MNLIEDRLKRITVFNCLEIFEIDGYHLSVTVFSNQNKVHISDRSEVDFTVVSRLSCMILQTVT